jgi:hypothetical protein
MEIIGHSSREMFDRYNTVGIEDRKRAVKVFEGFLHNQAASVYENVDQVRFRGNNEIGALDKFLSVR